MKRLTHQRGFSLIEVLVTLVIVTVALLSSAALQLLSKRSNYDAAQRTTAAHLAEDLLERMRNNSGSLLDYVPMAPLGGATQAAPAADCGDPATVCTAAEMAAYDLWQWERLLDGALETTAGRATGGLVSPTACIQGPLFGGNGVYRVAIAWRGMTDIANPVVDNCGEASGDYGAGDAYRRVLVVQSFINDI
jgi:type IV pilus assembly protein PilV